VEHHFFPGLTGSAGAYALVGMGTLFAGFLRVPMTSVFMVLELSGNYSIIVPVMISNTIAYLISRKYQKNALFDLLSRQDGVDLPSMEEQREQSTVLVENAMRPYTLPVLRGDETAAEALGGIENLSGGYLLVDQDTRGWSGVTTELLQWQVQQGKGGTLLANLPGQRLRYVHPDQPLEAALRQIGDQRLLPVVSRLDPRHLEGVVTLEDILRAYRAP